MCSAECASSNGLGSRSKLSDSFGITICRLKLSKTEPIMNSVYSLALDKILVGMNDERGL